MNPFRKFKSYIVSEALTNTDDVFEKAKIEILFNFTIFFLLLNIPYTIQSFSASGFLIGLALFCLLAFISIFFIIKITKNVTIAVYFYVINHAIQNIAHFLVNNGRLEVIGLLFYLLGALFPFLMIGRKWGITFTVFILGMIFLGIYNENTGYSLFHFPPEYADPPLTSDLRYLIVIPLLLNVYLISEFVKATQKAEKQIHDQKLRLESNNRELETQKEDIISSINYAKRIQQAVLPNEDYIQRGIPLSFIFYKPRDIVSGDFYWFYEIDRDNYIIVAADCTGHGVPGAFMTVIGSNLLTQIITENKITEPVLVLTELDKRITATLKQEKEHRQIIQDGMDLSLIKVNKINKEFIYTSAKRPAIFIRNKKIEEFKGSKNTLGGLRSGEKKFDEIKMNYEEDDMIYLFTDGYIDQFGGNDNKKFMIKRLRELLLEIHQLPVAEQKQKLDETITKWIGENEQTDDILIMGIRF
jgi:serine phosphatase RsbU (regulator of sigma subunit)